jgi:hypothetical protein
MSKKEDPQDVEEEIDETEEELEDELDEDVDPDQDEETEEEGEEGEEDDVDDDGEEEDDNPIIPITHIDEEGEEFEREIPYKELGKIVYESERMKDYIGKTDTMLQGIAPLLDKIKESKIIQDVLYYLDLGHSESEIMNGLPQLWAKVVQQNKPPQFDTYDQEMEWRAEQKAQQLIKPIQTQMQKMQAAQRQKEVYLNNRSVLGNTLKELGWDDNLSDSQTNKVQAAISEILPGIDIINYSLSDKQAKAIIMTALGKKETSKSNKASQKVQNLLKTAKIPRVLPSKSLKVSAKPKRERAIDAVSETDMAKRKQELFG